MSLQWFICPKNEKLEEAVATSKEGAIELARKALK